MSNEPSVAVKTAEFSKLVEAEHELERLRAENALLRERKDWWVKNAADIAKERAAAWNALVAIEPLFREDMPEGPDGQLGCATPEYQDAYRLLLLALRDRDALRQLLQPTEPSPECTISTR